MRNKAIFELYPNVLTIGDNVGVLDKNSNQVSIDESLVQARIAELQTEYEANQYQRDRQPEYPSIQDQLDMQYWDQVNGTNNWQQAIQAVKMKHPKPEND